MRTFKDFLLKENTDRFLPQISSMIEQQTPLMVLVGFLEDNGLDELVSKINGNLHENLIETARKVFYNKFLKVFFQNNVIYWRNTFLQPEGGLNFSNYSLINNNGTFSFIYNPSNLDRDIYLIDNKPLISIESHQYCQDVSKDSLVKTAILLYCHSISK